jgi:chromosomal replication initiation ATPase DnaA
MSRQLSFDLGRLPAMGAADFYLAPANRIAFRQMTEGAADWPQGKLALIGPQGSGKSHLVRIWQAQSGAQVIAAADLDRAALPQAGQAVAVEDADRLPQAAEVALFHLHNHVLAGGGTLLLTARRPPADWPVALPDLASRLLATAITRLGDPDDALLAGLMTKLFADRQLSPAPDLLPYLLARVERLVAALDSAALAQGRQITKVLARETLDKIAAKAEHLSQSGHQAPP